jgi:pimeloyl-ACP methyl ester carboxylesterase
VLGAANERSAAIFGVSSGAIIALDLATRHPEAVKTLIAHEPPLIRLHSQAKKWQKFFAGIYGTALRYGTTAAALRFILGAKLPLSAMIENGKQLEAFRKEHDSDYVSASVTDEVSFNCELLPVVNYLPDIARLKQSNVPIYVCAGDISQRKKCFYAESSAELARQLNGTLITLPGHHVSFFSHAAEWGTAVRRLLGNLPAGPGNTIISQSGDTPRG